MDPIEQTWHLDEREFPASGTDADKLRFALRYAILAPSGHNTQPWLFRVRGDAVEVFADRRRALPVVDPGDRELTISCGAATETLRVALHYFGLESAVDALPDESDADLLARVRLTGSAARRDEGLFQAIPLRRTVRQRYEPSPLPDYFLETMQTESAALDVAFDPITEEGRREAIAELVAEGDRLQFADRSFRRELAAWVHSRRAHSRDGISGAAMGMPDALSPVGAAVVRTFDVGNRTAAQDRDIVTGSPALGILSTADDTAVDWLNTGRALARVLLTATDEGVRASYLNQPIEVPELRPRLQAIAASQPWPQLLLRFGYGPLPQPAVRRPLEEVLI